MGKEREKVCLPSGERHFNDCYFLMFLGLFLIAHLDYKRSK